MKRSIMFVLQLIYMVSAVYANAANSRINFNNPELSVLRQAQTIGSGDPMKELTFTVWLKFRNKLQLDKLVDELYDPQNSKYQKFLTYEQFDAQFAPDKEAVNIVQNYFTSHGMRVKKVYSNLYITATVKQIEQVFQIKINNYHYQQKIVYGNASAPTIQSDIAQYISGITGLSNIPYAHPKIHHGKPQKTQNIAKPQILNFRWNAFVPKATPTNISFLQTFTGAQLRTAYNLANVSPVNGTPIDGTGQTIVIIDGCAHNTSAELMAFANQYNAVNELPMLTANNFAIVNHDGSPYTGPSCSASDGWDSEILLDMEASHTIAPGANIVLVITDNVDNAQVAEILNYIMSNNFTVGGFSNAYVVSNSWDNTYDEQNEPLDSTLQSAASMGMSINFAAGDCGDQTYNSSWACSQLSSSPSIQYPVSSTYVTAVSGTSLFVDNDWNYAFEAGWGTLVNGHYYSGSMGGISQWRSFPSWQSPISNFTAGGYGIVGQHNRAIPDIAMLADLFTGLLTYSSDCAPCYDGGASLATPLFSGTMTLVNQARALLAGTQNPIGQAAPYFYSNINTLISNRAINLVSPPHQIIGGAQPANGGPSYAFTLIGSPVASHLSDIIAFNWDSSLTIVEDQFWNDVVGVGSPNIPNFVQTMSTL